MPIEVEEPKTEEEEIMFSCLGLAKHFHEDRDDHPRGVEPTAFVFGQERRLTVVSLKHLMTDDIPRAVAADAIREIAAKERAYAVGFVSDTWMTEFADKKPVEAEGLRCERWRSWSDDQRARLVRRREALLLIFETRAGNKDMVQFYRRDRERIVWEELRVEVSTERGGRFTDLLPKED